MNKERFLEIMDENLDSPYEKGCKVVKGLLLVQKYLPYEGIEGAGHDVIYGTDIEKLVEAGITEEDTKQLNMLGWVVEDETYLARFV